MQPKQDNLICITKNNYIKLKIRSVLNFFHLDNYTIYCSSQDINTNLRVRVVYFNNSFMGGKHIL